MQLGKQFRYFTFVQKFLISPLSTTFPITDFHSIVKLNKKQSNWE